jgi:hypothetical protein
VEGDRTGTSLRTHISALFTALFHAVGSRTDPRTADTSGMTLRLGRVAAAVAAGLFLAASPASAEKPERGCADNFVISDLDEVKHVILEADADADPARIEAFFYSYDKNEEPLKPGSARPPSSPLR